MCSLANSWFGHRVLLIAAAGEELTDIERKEFKRLTGRDREPGKMVKELVAIFGRRSGKSFMTAVFVVWIAALCEHRANLAPGEVGVALIISRDQKIAKIILNYIEGILQSSEQLKNLITRRTQDTIELSNSISIEVRPCSASTLRGPTYIVIAGDEIAQWFTSVDFANPDVEVLAAVRPGLKTTRGPLLMVSSAYSQHGVLYDTWRKDFGPDGNPDILVAYGASRDLNPLLSQEEIDADIERDPIRNRAEYLSEFRTDTSGFIDRKVVEDCIGDYVELPPEHNIVYYMFLDAATGVPNGDSYTAAISHRVGRKVIIDAIREVRAPFSPSEVIANVIVPLAKQYKIYKIFGDNFAGAFAQEPIRDAGLQYEIWPKHKSDIYRDPLLSLLNSYQITLPRNDRGVNQICSLENSTQRSGRDQISHPSHGHDDIANAIAGAAAAAYNDASTSFDTSWSFVGDGPDETSPAKQKAAEQKTANSWWRKLHDYHAANGVITATSDAPNTPMSEQEHAEKTVSAEKLWRYSQLMQSGGVGLPYVINWSRMK